jgi:hypothetical protein
LSGCGAGVIGYDVGMIVVEWQNERGGCEARYSGPSIGSRLCELAPLNSACLRFIVPYADTTFNFAQVEVLEMELAEMARTAKNANVVTTEAFLDVGGPYPERPAGAGTPAPWLLTIAALL